MDQFSTPEQALAALTSPDLNERASALDILQQQRHANAPARLVTLLKDPSMPDDLRMRAAAVLRWQTSGTEPDAPKPAPTTAPPITLRLEPLPGAPLVSPTAPLVRPARRWPWALAGLLLLLLLIGGYYARGAWLIEQANAAYRESSCAEVLRIADTIAQQYPDSLAPYGAQVELPSAPCRIYVDALEQQDRKDWAAAYAAYTNLLKTYQDVPFAKQVAAQSDEAVFAWGRELRRDEDYQAALDAYALLTRPDDTVQERRGAAEMALFTEWAEQSRTEGDFAAAVEHLRTLLEYYPSDERAQPARERLPQIMFEWADALRAREAYADAEKVYHDLVDWVRAQGQAGLATRAHAELARMYLAWAAALQASSDFGTALSKLQLAAKTDPQPALPEGTAARARAAFPALHTAWGKQLIGQQRFNEAVSHLQIALDLQGADNALRAAASDQVASAYLAWGESLRGDEKFQLALERIARARDFAATQPVTDTVQQAEATTLNQFAHSSGADAQAVIDQATAQVCGGQGQGNSPLIARADTPKRVRAYGEQVALYDPAVRAGSPAELHYVVCVEQQVNTIETCSYHPMNTGITSAWLIREAIAWVVRLRSSTTAEIVAENTLYGTQPEACPFSATFYNGETRHSQGNAPTVEALQDWLRGFIQ